ncbi:MAG: hypothetical protein BWY80_01466 [Firmicutes bacterium ADurb.Bin456]|nr:MAG: hypothetical protein BWY80_01466 [Firmicutes bacterium ADurb.Bin456]
MNILVRLKGYIHNLKGKGSIHNDLVGHDTDFSDAGLCIFGQNFVNIRLGIGDFNLAPDHSLGSIFTLDRIDLKPLGSSHTYSSFQNFSILIYEGGKEMCKKASENEKYAKKRT